MVVAVALEKKKVSQLIDPEKFQTKFIMIYFIKNTFQL